MIPFFNISKLARVYSTSPDDALIFLPEGTITSASSSTSSFEKMRQRYLTYPKVFISGGGSAVSFDGFTILSENLIVETSDHYEWLQRRYARASIHSYFFIPKQFEVSMGGTNHSYGDFAYLIAPFQLPTKKQFIQMLYHVLRTDFLRSDKITGSLLNFGKGSEKLMDILRLLGRSPEVKVNPEIFEEGSWYKLDPYTQDVQQFSPTEIITQGVSKTYSIINPEAELLVQMPYLFREESVVFIPEKSVHFLRTIPYFPGAKPDFYKDPYHRDFAPDKTFLTRILEKADIPTIDRMDTNPATITISAKDLFYLSRNGYAFQTKGFWQKKGAMFIGTQESTSVAGYKYELSEKSWVRLIRYNYRMSDPIPPMTLSLI